MSVGPSAGVGCHCGSDRDDVVPALGGEVGARGIADGEEAAQGPKSINSRGRGDAIRCILSAGRQLNAKSASGCGTRDRTQVKDQSLTCSSIQVDGVRAAISQGEACDCLRGGRSVVSIESQCASAHVQGSDGTDLVVILGLIIEDQIPSIDTGGGHRAREASVVSAQREVCQALFKYAGYTGQIRRDRTIKETDACKVVRGGAGDRHQPCANDVASSSWIDGRSHVQARCLDATDARHVQRGRRTTWRVCDQNEVKASAVGDAADVGGIDVDHRSVTRVEPVAGARSVGKGAGGVQIQDCRCAGDNDVIREGVGARKIPSARVHENVGSRSCLGDPSRKISCIRSRGTSEGELKSPHVDRTRVADFGTARTRGIQG